MENFLLPTLTETSLFSCDVNVDVAWLYGASKMSKSTLCSEQPSERVADLQVPALSQHRAATTTVNNDTYDDYLYYNEVALRN